MTKYHAGQLTTSGMFMVMCGRQGQLMRRGANINGLVHTKVFASFMATEPDNCCEHCKREMQRKFPKRIANAAKDPVGYINKFIAENRAA
jgi:hypothetical protein